MLTPSDAMIKGCAVTAPCKWKAYTPAVPVGPGYSAVPPMACAVGAAIVGHILDNGGYLPALPHEFNGEFMARHLSIDCMRSLTIAEHVYAYTYGDTMQDDFDTGKFSREAIIARLQAIGL